MSKPGRPYRWTPQTELDNFTRCPVCHQWFDMRDPVQTFEHMHDGAEAVLEQEKTRH